MIDNSNRVNISHTQTNHVAWVDSLLHWLIALGVFIMLPFGLLLEQLPDDGATFDLIIWHQRLGTWLLVLLVLRFCRRLHTPFPKPTGQLSTLEAIARRTMHLCLMVLLFIMVLSGLVYASGVGYSTSMFGLFDIPAYVDGKRHLANWGGMIHELDASLLMWLVLLHVAAACKHQFVDKDDTLGRMIRPLFKRPDQRRF